MAMKKQAVVLIALTWLLVLATIAISAHATAAGTVEKPDAFKDPNVAQPMAGCRCCTFFRNQYGLLQCGYVCCTDGCC